MSALQLDLFGEVVSTERQRYLDALTCLRDAVPEALEIVAELRAPPRDSRSPHASGDWAYCVSRAGLRVETTQEWWAGARERGETWGWDHVHAQWPARRRAWQLVLDLLGDAIAAQRADTGP